MQYAAGNGGTDPLLAEFKKTDPASNKPYANDFGWINHTWDHPNLDQGCATQNYIEAEIQQNTSWGSSADGLNLTSTTDPSVALGAENPSVLVTGEHSGLANLLPGNPGIIDPPSFDSATVSPTGGTLPAGSYTYAITDQFSATGGESSASETVQTVPANGSVALTWDAVCHAYDYKIYREVTGSDTWTLVKTIPAVTDTSAFANPVSTTDTSGGGPLPQSYTDTGADGTPSATAPPTVNSAVESAYEQNQSLDAAFKAAGIKTFGSDSSKPYPNPANATFANGSAPASQYPGGATFTEPTSGAQAEARYPTNIYYNVSTEAQEVDEYNHLYLPSSLGGACTASATTTCLTAPATFADIINSITQGMLQHILGNDPRPDYFHQTNMMGTPPAGDPTDRHPPGDLPERRRRPLLLDDEPAAQAVRQLLQRPRPTADQHPDRPAARAAGGLGGQHPGQRLHPGQPGDGHQRRRRRQRSPDRHPERGQQLRRHAVRLDQRRRRIHHLHRPEHLARSRCRAGTAGHLGRPAGYERLPARRLGRHPGRVQPARHHSHTGVRNPHPVGGEHLRCPRLAGAGRQHGPQRLGVQRPERGHRGAEVRQRLQRRHQHLRGRLGQPGAHRDDQPQRRLGPRIYSLSGFSQGEWLTFPVNVAAGATVTISATNTHGGTPYDPTAVISAVMIGDAGAPPVTAGTQAPQGNWSKAYGAAGYDLAGLTTGPAT